MDTWVPGSPGPLAMPAARNSSGGGPDDPTDSQTLRRLRERPAGESRYRIEGEIARGGMGAILKVWDQDLQRHLAMKVLLPERCAPLDSQAPRALARFLSEAQITGQLQHPSVVAVHEIGIAEDGRVFFTMPLVKGRHLGQVLSAAREGEAGWNRTRVVGVLQRACEAVAFAHERRVLHRDLKPANIMVGRHGEVFVMDWGLARLLDAPDLGDARLAGAPPDATEIAIERLHGDPDEPLVTVDGDVVGTPAYMSPEQARGELEALGPQTDVYSMGAILYELLAGHAPYGAKGARLSPRSVWRFVLDGPPARLAQLAPGAPAELVAIAERAMARDPAERYADMRALAEDLRAYLEGRVVAAHAVGPWPEFKKWVGRNRLAAAIAAGALTALLASGFLLAARERERAAERALFLDQESAAVLLAEVDRLWPLHSTRLAAIDTWIERAEDLLARHGALLVGAAFDADMAAQAPLGGDPQAEELQRLSRARTMLEEWLESISPPSAARLAELLEESRDPERERVILPSEIRRLGMAERRLVLERDRHLAMAAGGTGFAEALRLLADPKVGELAAVRARRDTIRRLAEAEQRDAELWRQVAGPHDGDYGGLVLEPQWGLVPLGQNPSTGLHEFWVEASGERPERDADGNWRMGDDTGLVLVLVPRRKEPVLLHFLEGPPLEVTLDEPYFLSRTEMTLGQWIRLTGDAPNVYGAGVQPKGSATIGQDHPVENITWWEAREVLARLGLVLPTEAMWQHAALAGGPGPFWPGDAQSLRWTDNLAGTEVNEHGMGAYVDWRDDFVAHAPVTALPPNPFGLHHVHGNVHELVVDDFDAKAEAYVEFEPPGGRGRTNLGRQRSMRGGSWTLGTPYASAYARYPVQPDARHQDIGVRPARFLDRRQQLPPPDSSPSLTTSSAPSLFPAPSFGPTSNPR